MTSMQYSLSARSAFSCTDTDTTGLTLVELTISPRVLPPPSDNPDGEFLTNIKFTFSGDDTLDVADFGFHAKFKAQLKGKITPEEAMAWALSRGLAKYLRDRADGKPGDEETYHTFDSLEKGVIRKACVQVSFNPSSSDERRGLYSPTEISGYMQRQDNGKPFADTETLDGLTVEDLQKKAAQGFKDSVSRTILPLWDDKTLWKNESHRIRRVRVKQAVVMDPSQVAMSSVEGQ